MYARIVSFLVRVSVGCFCVSNLRLVGCISCSHRLRLPSSRNRSRSRRAAAAAAPRIGVSLLSSVCPLSLPLTSHGASHCATDGCTPRRHSSHWKPCFWNVTAAGQQRHRLPQTPRVSSVAIDRANHVSGDMPRETVDGTVTWHVDGACSRGMTTRWPSTRQAPYGVTGSE